MAEKEGWKIYEENKDKFQLTVVMPALVWGPGKGKSASASAELILKLINNEMPYGIPDMRIGVVDVRDVA